MMPFVSYKPKKSNRTSMTVKLITAALVKLKTKENRQHYNLSNLVKERKAKVLLRRVKWKWKNVWISNMLLRVLVLI
jgi:hypothetical protein